MLDEFTPIKLTNKGDMLLVEHGDTDELPKSCIGIHNSCGNPMDRANVSKTEDAVVCPTHGFGVPFKREIKTYGELRQFFALRLNQSLE